MVGCITNSMDMSSEQAPGAGDGQGILACCTPWDHKESDTTEGQNWFFTVSSSYPSAVIQIFLLFFGEIENICLVEGLVLPQGQCWHISFARNSGLRGYAFNILASLLTCCMTKCKLLNCSLPWISYLWNGYFPDAKLMVGAKVKTIPSCGCDWW